MSTCTQTKATVHILSPFMYNFFHCREPYKIIITANLEMYENNNASRKTIISNYFR